MPASWEQLRIRTAGHLVVVGGVVTGLPPGPTRGAAVIHLRIARMLESDPWGSSYTTPCLRPSLTPLAVAYRTGSALVRRQEQGQIEPGWSPRNKNLHLGNKDLRRKRMSWLLRPSVLMACIPNWANRRCSGSPKRSQ